MQGNEERARGLLPDDPREDLGGASRGSAAVLITDVVRSTDLLRRLGDGAGEHVLRTCLDLLREPLGERGGREVKSLGDGLLVAFRTPGTALSAAVEMQRAARTPQRDAGFRAARHSHRRPRGRCRRGRVGRSRGNDRRGRQPALQRRRGRPDPRVRSCPRRPRRVVRASSASDRTPSAPGRRRAHRRLRAHLGCRRSRVRRPGVRKRPPHPAPESSAVGCCHRASPAMRSPGRCWSSACTRGSPAASCWSSPVPVTARAPSCPRPSRPRGSIRLALV